MIVYTQHTDHVGPKFGPALDDIDCSTSFLPPPPPPTSPPPPLPQHTDHLHANYLRTRNATFTKLLDAREDCCPPFHQRWGRGQTLFLIFLCSLTDFPAPSSCPTLLNLSKARELGWGKRYIYTVAAVSAQKFNGPFPFHDNHASAGSRDIPTALLASCDLAH